MQNIIRVAFFDTKSFERTVFESQAGDGIEFKFLEPRLDRDTVRLTAGYTCVCAFVNDEINADVVDGLAERGVRLLALRCAGYNNVDIEAARGKLSIVRVPAYSPHAVAEHAMALLLTSVRRIHKAYIRTRDFNFSLGGLTGFDLYGKTVGVIGTGKIGKTFIDICRGFGMKVIAYDPFPLKNSGIAYVSRERIFTDSDIISFHCPLTEDTYHMLNRDTIKNLKKGVVIINTSRGALIDSEALLDGIRSRIIGATCLDVYEEESDVFFEDNSGHIMDDEVLARLLFMPNVIITSHQAFLTNEALEEIARVTVENITEFFDRGKSVNQIV